MVTHNLNLALIYASHYGFLKSSSFTTKNSEQLKSSVAISDGSDWLTSLKDYL